MNSDARRLILAFAVAIALHEILAGLIPASNAPHAAQPEIVSRVTVARIAVAPTPTPTPPPRRPIVARVHVIAPVESHIVAHVVSGMSAHPQPLHRIAAAAPKPPVMVHAKPIWDIPVGGQGAGAGNRSGAGSPGNGAASGNGEGQAGAGNGAGGGTQPCGFVTFSNADTRYDRRTGGYWINIQMSVHYADGGSDTVMLDYPWYYRDEASNPWSQRNVDNPTFETPFQFPPPASRANEPALVRYVMEHTSSDGYTSLKPCPLQAR